jgi:16S rRNA (cytidine1402-2'-O)-methyltransferase
MPGTLFVVATPIGNLEDLTFRGLRTLREVDLIAAEDTRRTAKLLAHYEVSKPVVSLREHNEDREGPKLVRRLTSGESIALVTDAGTPGISDPGARFVSLVQEAGISVVPIPGCSAVTAALSASGAPGSSFRFVGFPPPSGTARTDWLNALASESSTIVFLEAPHRIARTLADAESACLNRRIIVFRELTKINEQLVVYTKDRAQEIKPLGEFTVVIEPADVSPHESASDSELAHLFLALTDGIPFSRERALELLSRLSKAPDVHAKNRIKKALLLAKQQKKPIA